MNTDRNPVEHEVMNSIKARWSPYQYDTDKPVSREDLLSLFEAARWAMSASNVQPWRYIVADRHRDPELWSKVLDCLAEGNRAWAYQVPVLALGLVYTHDEESDRSIPTALHDLGTASAFLALEAASRGIAAHQMAGIQPDRIRELFELPDALKPVTAIAIGYASSNAELDDKYAARDDKLRTRKSLSEIILHGSI